MKDLLKIMRNTALSLSLLTMSAVAMAEVSKADSETIQAVGKFSDESSKMREDHIQTMREIHIKHVNEMYDRKLSHNKEMTDLWKQLKPGDKAANKALREQIKAKQKGFEKEEETFRKDFKENVLKKKNMEFREIMNSRKKEMKGKFKE